MANPKMAKFYRGCYASNRIPKPIGPFPFSLISNWDRYSMPGTHWIALFVPHDGECIYFCSYGLPPNEEILNYLQNHFQKFTRNLHGFQSPGATNCGKYCILFIYFMSIGWNFDHFINYLSNFKNSDHFVNDFFQKINE